jgi:hypothetical protein
MPKAVSVFAMIGMTGSGGRSLAQPMWATLPSLRTTSSPIAEDAEYPLVSITTSAPRPPVRSRIACLASVSATLTQSVAPYARETANGASRASVTISRPAPDRARSRVSASPIGPCPRTATVSPRAINSRSTVFEADGERLEQRDAPGLDTLRSGDQVGLGYGDPLGQAPVGPQPDQLLLLAVGESAGGVVGALPVRQRRLDRDGEPDQFRVGALADALHAAGEVVTGYAGEGGADPAVVLVHVGAAQRRGLDGDDDPAGWRLRVGPLLQLDGLERGEDRRLHQTPSGANSRSRMISKACSM